MKRMDELESWNFLPLLEIKMEDIDKYTTVEYYGKIIPKHVIDLTRIAYGQSFRKYHNFNHIVFMFSTLTPKMEKKLRDVEVFRLAILFHDIVYEVGDENNEVNSADLAKRLTCGLNKELTLYMVNLIKSTKGFKYRRVKSYDAKLLHDLDYSILADFRYPEYANAIFREVFWYKGVSENYNAEVLKFKQARMAFIKEVLKSSIFLTDHFKEYEVKAKENLANELKEWEDYDFSKKG